jgi:uncharacterized protein (DUF362 family)
MTRDEMTRREFMKRAIALGATVSAAGALAGLEEAAEAAGEPTIVVAAKQKEPAALARAAVNGLGGMGRFVKKGNVVLVKPNIGWARRPDQAATTNPELVAEVIRMCREAGAREVLVADNPVDRPGATVLKTSGIAAAARAAGAKVTAATAPQMFQHVSLKRAKLLRSVDVLRDLRRADVFINLPIAKVHSSTVLTLSCKNVMGLVSDRGAWHRDGLDQCIADFINEFRPDLTVLDAYRILTTNGPKGPGRTEDPKLVVAGTDPLAIDAFGATLFDKKAEEIGHLRAAAALGVGQIDLKRIRVKRV